MASIITPAELRSALNGVSSSLYSDAVLTEIIDTAESVVGNLLVKWNAPIDKHYSESTTVSTIHTTKPHKFYATQTVAIETARMISWIKSPSPTVNHCCCC